MLRLFHRLWRVPHKITAAWRRPDLAIRVAYRYAAPHERARIARNPRGYVILQYVVQPAVTFSLGAVPFGHYAARGLCWVLWRIVS